MLPQNPQKNDLGEFIRQKLLTTQLSTDNLASLIISSGIKCDGSTIRQIIKGTRVPKIGSPVIEAIAKELGISLEEIEKYHRKSADEKRANRSPKQKTHAQKGSDALIEPLTGLTERTFVQDSRLVKKPRPKSIVGSSDLIATKIQILKELLTDPSITNGSPDEKTIIIVFQGEINILADSEYQNEYQNSLADIISQGWNVKHFVRLDPNFRERTFEFVSNAFRYFGKKGKYEPRYLNTMHILEPSYGVFLITGKEALISLSADQEKMADSALYIKDKDSLEIIHKHCEQIEKKSKPIFRLDELSTYERKDFIQELFIADNEPGHRYIITKRLTEITRPLSWYEESHQWAKALLSYLKSSGSEDVDLSNHIATRKHRAENLILYLDKGSYNCYYIYPKSIFEEFIETGKTEPYYFQASKEQVIEQLETIKSLLERDNYNLALVDSEVFNQIEPAFCEVQGNHLVIMEFWKNKDDSMSDSIKSDDFNYISQWYLADEPIIVRAFQDRLSQIWQSLDKESKEKYKNLAFIQRKIDQIKMNLEK